tara:strand:- start:1398 stop:1517 length:120 start_codon:yes stop_codon:yes gene_type:complete
MSKIEKWASQYVATMQLTRTLTGVVKLIVAVFVLIEVLK